MPSSAPDHPLMPDAAPGFQSLSFVGLFAARGTPEDLSAKLTEEFRALLDESGMRRRMLDLGALSSSIGMSDQDFRVRLASDSQAWGDIVRAGKANRDPTSA